MLCFAVSVSSDFLIFIQILNFGLLMIYNFLFIIPIFNYYNWKIIHPTKIYLYKYKFYLVIH